MAGSPLDRRPHGFALGLIGFAWAALILLGPLALFLTWYGDCFSESCPSATRLDGAIYLFDIAAVVAVAVIVLIAVARPRRVWFVTIVVIGLAFTAEAVAGLLGYRGLYAFSILLPAGVLMTVGGVAGVRTIDDRSLPWMLDSTEAAFGVGCAVFGAPIIVLMVASAITNGEGWAELLVVALAATLAVVFFVRRRRGARRPPPDGAPGDPP